jgi:hypothetical protein
VPRKVNVEVKEPAVLRETQLDIREIAVAHLHEDEENAKLHTDMHIDMVATSIENYGFNDPVGVVSMDGEDYLIVEGHGRVRAAKLLGIDKVPCLMLDHLSADERRAYAIAHNQTQQNTPLRSATVAEEFDRIGVSPDAWHGLGFTDDDAMFLPSVIDGVAQVGWSETDEEGSVHSATSGQPNSKNTWKEYIPAVHRTTLRFGTDIAYQRFVRLLEIIREQHPTTGSIAERVGVVLDRLAVPRPPKPERADA